MEEELIKASSLSLHQPPTKTRIRIEDERSHLDYKKVKSEETDPTDSSGKQIVPEIVTLNVNVVI